MYRWCQPALIVERRNRQMVLTASVVVFFALLTNVSAQFKDKSDLLRPFTMCKLEGGLRIKEVKRRPKAAPKFREVETDKGQERVSVLDGYRVMFGFGDLLYFFANVKIEQSDAQRYLADKEAIIRSLKLLAAPKQTAKVIYVDKTDLNGFEHYGADRDVIDVGGVIGTHVLFYDARQLVITIYVLNQDQGPGGLLFRNNRRFNDINGYRALRDHFLSNYSECLQRVAETAPR